MEHSHMQQTVKSTHREIQASGRRPDIWMLILQAPSGERRCTVSLISALVSILFLSIALLYHSMSLPELGNRTHGAIIGIIFAIGIMLPVYTLLEWIGARYFLTQQDFRFEDSAWKRLVRDLFQFKFGLSKTFLALAFGAVIAVVFDYFLASRAYGSVIGQTARILADLCVLLHGMAAFAVMFLRER